MFNHHQNHGGVNPQMVQMQRLMANRPPRSSAFMAVDMPMNTPAELNELNDRRYSMGNSWAQQQRNFSSLAHQQNMLGFTGRTSEFNNNFGGMMGRAATAMNPLAAAHSAGMAQMSGGGTSTSSNGNFIGSTGIRMPLFKCPECGIVKNTSEELEIHTKTEHLNWLPFICQHCGAARASDIQMREHMHSSHKKNDYKYGYHDNPQAKKILQEMMDKVLFGASVQFQQQQLKRRGGGYDGDHAGGNHHDLAAVKKARVDEAQGEGQDKQRVAAVKKMVGDEGQAKSNNVAASSDKERQQSIDEETDAQLNTIFGRNVNVKSEFDMCALDGGTPSPLQHHHHHPMMLPNEEDDLPDDNSHQLDALQNVAAMFSASGGSDRLGQGSASGRSIGGGANRNQSAYFAHPKRIVRNRPGPMTSKKRVLGECARCHKPITAGARQMHMFFHLGKDMRTYRFRCKHPGCDVQHYRKDQMENHQSKAHGRVDPNMMDDRSQELYNLVQKMSMELLGTTGNTPGPTAAKAQMMYDQQMQESQTSSSGGLRRRSNRLTDSPNEPAPTPHVVNPNRPIFDSANRKMEDLVCRLCNKSIMSRIRGFHILWHLNNDLGIVRYGCKFCNFKHDRPQSVASHGARDHGVEECCEDLLYNFEDELKSMSKACFGVERLFAKEIRRRNKLERDGAAGDYSPNQEDDDDSQNGGDTKVRRNAQIGNLRVPLKPDSSERSWTSWTPKDQVKKRRSLRRFGTRRTKSKRQKEEMIKLREVSMRLGGAQYFKKKSNEAIECAKCGKMVTNRLSDHAYSHLSMCDLFRCQQCDLGHFSRDNIVRHLRDFHNTSNEHPLDNRLRFAQEIKDAIRECYPTLFVDAPIPNKEDIEKLKANLKLKNMVVDADSEEEEEDGDEKEEEDGEKEGDDEEEEEEDGAEVETTGNDESGANDEEETGEGEEEELMEEEEEEEEGEHDDEEEEDPDYDEEEDDQEEYAGEEEAKKGGGAASEGAEAKGRKKSGDSGEKSGGNKAVETKEK